MKFALRIVTLTIVVALISNGLTGEVVAESRSKALKRAEKELRQANFESAEKIYRHLIDRDQADKEARVGLSFALFKQGKFQEGYEHAAQVLAADPLNSRAYALVGTILLRTGEFRNSIESLYTAVKFNDREALAIAGLSEIEYFENRSRNAYLGFKRAVDLEPNEPDYYIMLARVCSRLEYYSEAADMYERFLVVSPKTDVERRARIKGLIDFYRYLGTTKIHRVSGKEVTTIPFKLINHRPFIEVTINGKGPLKFVIDTGASLSVISDQTAQRLGIKAVARGGSARAVGGSGTFPIVYALADSLVVGDAKIDSVPIYIRTVHTTDDMPKSDRPDGYIGLSVLANYAMTIDYQNRQIILDRTPIREDIPGNTKDAAKTESAKPIEPGSAEEVKQPSATESITTDGLEIPIRSTSGGLASAETHLPTADRPLNFIIDTGATVSVVSKAAVKLHKLENLIMEGVKFRVIGAAGIEDNAEALRISSLNVSGLQQKNARALVLDLDAVNETSGFEQHGILGGDYLSHFRVLLDLRRFHFKLTPQSPAISVTAQKQ